MFTYFLVLTEAAWGRGSEFWFKEKLVFQFQYALELEPVTSDFLSDSHFAPY